jgi:2-hydroxychromene-2-carboxylate isomerase
VFNVIGVDAVNLNDAAPAAQLLADAGFDAAQVFGWAGEAEVKAALRANTDEAVSRRVFGSPTMFVGGEMFFGQNRL